MLIKIKDVEVNYIQYGKVDGEDILLLHGWGQNIEMMKMLGDNFSSKYRITILDLPGFGESEEPKVAWMLDDYVEMLNSLVNNLGIKRPIVMGHSFGGRLTILYSSIYEVSKVILFGSPIKPERSSPSLKVKVLKSIKKLPLMDNLGEKMKKYIGSRDYKAASPVMRQILVNTVNKDLTDSAKKIKAPTLIIWGDNDLEAPLEDAKTLDSVIKDSGLIVLPGSHYAYLENLEHVVKILNSFL